VLGPRFTGARSIWLDDDDLQRFRDRGATIAHNPSANLRLGSGIAPARQMLDLGIGVGVGSDGAGSSDNQNMFEAMRAASLVSRIMTPDLICVLDSVSGEAIGTETLRYGQRVTVIVLPAPPVLLTPKGLEHVGPQAFGYDLEFRSVFSEAAE